MSTTALAAPATPAPTADIPTMPIYRLSVAQYHAMIEQGILTKNDRVELIRGWLVPSMGYNPPHRVAVGKVRRARPSKLSSASTLTPIRPAASILPSS